MTDACMQINKYAFSGGQDTIEKHRELGGDCSLDVSYQYLYFFLDDTDRLKEIERVLYNFIFTIVCQCNHVVNYDKIELCYTTNCVKFLFHCSLSKQFTLCTTAV